MEGEEFKTLSAVSNFSNENVTDGFFSLFILFLTLLHDSNKMFLISAGVYILLHQKIITFLLLLCLKV